MLKYGSRHHEVRFDVSERKSFGDVSHAGFVGGGVRGQLLGGDIDSDESKMPMIPSPGCERALPPRADIDYDGTRRQALDCLSDVRVVLPVQRSVESLVKALGQAAVGIDEAAQQGAVAGQH